MQVVVFTGEYFTCFTLQTSGGAAHYDEFRSERSLASVITSLCNMTIGSNNSNLSRLPVPSTKSEEKCRAIRNRRLRSNRESIRTTSNRDYNLAGNLLQSTGKSVGTTAAVCSGNVRLTVFTGRWRPGTVHRSNEPEAPATFELRSKLLFSVSIGFNKSRNLGFLTPLPLHMKMDQRRDCHLAQVDHHSR